MFYFQISHPEWLAELFRGSPIVKTIFVAVGGGSVPHGHCPEFANRRLNQSSWRMAAANRIAR
jgi:hypothetical protein